MRKQINRLLELIEHSTNQKPQNDARRASFRYIWPGHATVQLVDSNGSSEPLFITLGHISRSGLEFRSTRRFQLDQKLLITLEIEEGQLQIPATVVHSTQSVLKFVIGVKFDLLDICQTDDDGQADDSNCQVDDSKCQTAGEQ